MSTLRNLFTLKVLIISGIIKGTWVHLPKRFPPILLALELLIIPK